MPFPGFLDVAQAMVSHGPEQPVIGERSARSLGRFPAGLSFGEPFQRFLEAAHTIKNCPQVIQPIVAFRILRQELLGQGHDSRRIGHGIRGQDRRPHGPMNGVQVVRLAKPFQHDCTGLAIAFNVPQMQTQKRVVVPGKGIGAFQLDGPGDIGRGFLPLFRFGLGIAAVAPIQGRLRLQFDGFRKISDGLVPLSELAVGIAPVVPIEGDLGLQLDGFGVVGDGLVVLLRPGMGAPPDCPRRSRAPA